MRVDARTPFAVGQVRLKPKLRCGRKRHEREREREARRCGYSRRRWQDETMVLYDGEIGSQAFCREDSSRENRPGEPRFPGTERYPRCPPPPTLAQSLLADEGHRCPGVPLPGFLWASADQSNVIVRTYVCMYLCTVPAWLQRRGCMPTGHSFTRVDETPRNGIIVSTRSNVIARRDSNTWIEMNFCYLARR